MASETFESLQDSATELYMQAVVARQRGAREDARELLREAFARQKGAAEALRTAFDREPERALAYKSAASLAIELSEYSQAEELVKRGLESPNCREIGSELQALDLEAQAHWGLGALSLTFYGGDARKRGLPWPELRRRIDSLQDLLFRIKESWVRPDYRSSGNPTLELQRELLIDVRSTRLKSGSAFTVELTVGWTPQAFLPGLERSNSTKRVLMELVQGLRLVDSLSFDELRQMLPLPAYRHKFVELARELAPDGKVVRSIDVSVGFHTSRESVVLKRRSRDIPRPTTNAAPAELFGSITEYLGGTVFRFAASNGATYEAIVPADRMGRLLAAALQERQQVAMVGQFDGGAFVVDSLNRKPVASDWAPSLLEDANESAGND